MRLTILALFLCVGSTAICQSKATAPVNREKQDQLATQPRSNFSPLTMPVQSDPKGWNNAQRDWKINPQQPLSFIGGQPFGTLVALNDQPHTPPQSGAWPNAKVQPIPTQW